MDNLAKQIEEVEALCSIYADEFKTESENARKYSIKITEKNIELILYVTLPPEYPSESPPTYVISAPSIDRKQKEYLHILLDNVYLENVGETVLFQWIEKIREMLQSIEPGKGSVKNKAIETELGDLVITADEKSVPCPEIIHGEVIVDRKSSFQGHAAVVHSTDEVFAVLSELKKNKKIYNATHNMYAYRIKRKTKRASNWLQDYDDDGEAHGGGRMLHLLQILNQENMLVVVSRWYGGIQLGPDRFRHINNAARQCLQQAGFIKN